MELFINIKNMIEISKLTRSYKIAKGFEDRNGEPKKCMFCNSSNLIRTNEFTEEYFGVVEFTLKCKDCNATLGHWAYGEWLR